ncbi:unnamed protein product [Paramecium octaurelia]|uniref:VWFA domain-containing protein n=1 Tax=Paramecium octaurelia TaxID=43137 RepID=A0A8S1SZ16_PAROT|nr:unnamed protein product [Paramecium octaurelia]
MYQSNQPGYSINIQVYCKQLNGLRYGQSYQLIVFTKDPDGVFQEFKVIDNYSNDHHVMFKFYGLKYLFEMVQPLKFDLYLGQQFIGQCQANLGEILGDKQRVFYLSDLMNQRNGMISFKTERSQENIQKIKFDIYLQLNNSLFQSLLSLFKEQQSLSLILYKKIPNKQVILQTEAKPKSSQLNWKKIETSFEILCDNDPLQSIFCEVIQHEGFNQQSLGEFEFWKYQIDKNVCLFNITNLNNEIIGRSMIDQFEYDIEGQFYNFIQQGTQLALIIAIDFTESNKNPYNNESLHSITKESQYLQAIEQVAKILMDYDSDKKVPMYGFGGVPRYLQNYNKHCFPLQGEAQSLEDIRRIYEFSVKNIKLDGPTCFNPMIRQVMKWAQEDLNANGNQYFVLLILTDGKYMDEDQTIMSIVDAGNLPLSLIIVGIGDSADLKAMDKLDGNNGLWDTLGRQAERDLVKYVHYNKVKNDQGELAKELLDELPKQLVLYKTKKK